MPTVENVQEVFTLMVDEFDPDAVGDMDAVLKFDVSGAMGGTWLVTIGGGQIGVEKDGEGAPTTSLMLSDVDFLRLVNGELNPVSAFMQGLIKIDGDMSVAMKLQKLLGS